MRSILVSVSVLVLVSAPGLAATPKTAAPAPARRLPAPEDVSSRARQELKARMGQHATSTQNLVRAVVLLDRPTIQVLAERIAGEQTFTPSATWQPNIPPQVFSEGAAFAAAARELAFAAATRSNDDVLADRFAAVTRRCVSCHSGYLHGQRPRPPIGYERDDPGPNRDDPGPF